MVKNIFVVKNYTFIFNKKQIICSIIASWVIRGTTKTRDRMGLAGIRSRVLAFGTIGSRVPGFVFAITDIICFLTLAINNIDAMVIGSRPVPADPASRVPGLVAPVISIP